MVEVRTDKLRCSVVWDRKKTPHNVADYIKGALEFVEELVEATNPIEYINENSLCMEASETRYPGGSDKFVRIQLAWGGPALEVCIDDTGDVWVEYYDWGYHLNVGVEVRDEIFRAKLANVAKDLHELFFF